MTFSIPVALGAWFLYLAVGILIGRIPDWARPGSLRNLIAWVVPGIGGIERTVATGELGYAVAGTLSAAMVYALLDKRARDA